MTSNRAVDVVVSLLLLALAGVLGYDNWRTGVSWDATGPQPGYFPFYLALLMAGACVYGLAKEYLARRQPSETFVTREQFTRVLQVFVPTLAFCVLTQWLGLYVASFALIAGFMYFIGHIKAWKSVLTGYLFSAAMFAVFELAFDVIMPKGPVEALFGH